MPTLHRRRNPVAQAAILRKGGVHEKSRKTKRQKQKRDLRKLISKAMDDTNSVSRNKKTSPTGEVFFHKASTYLDTCLLFLHSHLQII